MQNCEFERRKTNDQKCLSLDRHISSLSIHHVQSTKLFDVKEGIK